MRSVVLPGLSCLLIGLAGPEARSQVPIRRFDREGTIAKAVAATEAEKKNGLVATVTLKDVDEVIQVTAETKMQLQKGKLVEAATADDLKEGVRVSVWLLGKPEKGDPPRVKAEAVLIFPGK